MPLNWSAYEDIADFFSNEVKELDGRKVYGHMDYGKRIPRWAGASPTPGCRWPAPPTGAVHGLPVNKWGIRVADNRCTPVGASVERGGAGQQPGRGLRPREVHRLDEAVRAARRPPA